MWLDLFYIFFQVVVLFHSRGFPLNKWFNLNFVTKLIFSWKIRAIFKRCLITFCLKNKTFIIFCPRGIPIYYYIQRSKWYQDHKYHSFPKYAPVVSDTIQSKMYLKPMRHYNLQFTFTMVSCINILDPSLKIAKLIEWHQEWISTFNSN